MNRRSVRFGLMLTAAWLGASLAHAEEPSCQAWYDAAIKAATTPRHVFATDTPTAAGGKTAEWEYIFVGDKRYEKFNGKWTVEPHDAKTAVAMLVEMQSLETGPACIRIGEETFDGQAATIYGRYRRRSTTIDSRVWIANASGLPIRLIIEGDPDSESSKGRTETRTNYRDVKPPAL